MLTFEQLQAELRPWVEHNFGKRPSWQPALGLVEEAGELSHAVLKRAQGIRGSTAEHDAAIRDAIADLIIFLADFCNSHSLAPVGSSTFVELDLAARMSVRGGNAWKLALRIGSDVGAIANAEAQTLTSGALNGRQHTTHLVKNALRSIALLAAHEKIDLQQTVESTWTRVRQRDWKANPHSAADVVAQSAVDEASP